MRHGAGSAHLIHGGYSDDCDEGEIEVVEKDEKGCGIFGPLQSPQMSP